MTTSNSKHERGEAEAMLRVVSVDERHDDSWPEVIPRDRLEEARAKIGYEAYWAGRNLASRLSARVAA